MVANERMEEIPLRQIESIEKDRPGVNEDVALHQEIGWSSGNALPASLVSPMRHHRRDNHIVTSMPAVASAEASP